MLLLTVGLKLLHPQITEVMPLNKSFYLGRIFEGRQL
tara:strand:- start:133 stop:243 length:111 start_codon:yes stop_codon:yes gene_type:complete